MRWLAVRSVPLSKETRNAWRAHNTTFVRRSNIERERIATLVQKHDVRGIFNLGNLNIPGDVFDCPVFTDRNIVRAVSHPNALARTLEGLDLLPAARLDVPHWHKAGGFKGAGVGFHEEPCTRPKQYAPHVQEHIEGTEYRIITVGSQVVQAAKKTSIEWKNGKHYVEYEWVGVDGIRKGGFISHIKKACEQIPNGAYAILGWDVIFDGKRPWILEANTSPGVNEATAGRIIKAVERIV